MRFCLLLFLSVWLWLPVTSSRAADYQYPKAAPVLSLTIPGDWDVTEQTGPALLLLCTPPDEESYTISVMSLPTVGDKADLTSILSKITLAGAKGAGMTDITVAPAKEETVGQNPRLFTRISATGKHNDEPSAFVYYAFRLPSTGRTYAIGVAGVQAMIDAHRKDFEAVVNSLTSLTGREVGSATGPSPTPLNHLLGDAPKVELRLNQP